MSAGRIIEVSRYRREDIRANPDKLYVFGDNFAGVGRGGQAKECRGEPNTVGIVTKWHPTMDAGAFLTDEALPRIRYRYQQDFRRLAEHLAAGGDVVWPRDGVGTGLARLPQSAPAVFDYIQRCFGHLKSFALPS